MVELSDYQIPPPRNWQRFESLCHRLWREILRDPSAQKHGRQGQAQHGVDVFGQRSDTKQWGGVQYEGKTTSCASGFE